MRLRFRLVPVLIVAACLLLGIKLVNLWTVIEARAAPAAPAAAPQPEPRPAPPAHAQVDGKPTPAPARQPGAKEPAAAVAPAPAAGAKAATDARDPILMTPEEVDQLQKLSERRAQLDRQARELSQQEVLLKAAERRIVEKVNKIGALEQQQQAAAKAAQPSPDDTKRIESLVKIYETMKPQDAARIFNELDMSVLLDVIEHMKERKVAPVLALMDSQRAKQVTQAIAERRRQRGEVPPAAPPPASASAAAPPAPQQAAKP